MDERWLALGLGLVAGAVIAWLILTKAGLGPPASLSNVEEWELVEDERGELKKIVVHRRVRRV